jgi:hypothetical protein
MLEFVNDVQNMLFLLDNCIDFTLTAVINARTTFGVKTLCLAISKL